MNSFLKFIIFAIFFSSGIAEAKVSNKKYYVAGCNVYNENFKFIKNFGGTLCAFFDDGTYVVSLNMDRDLVKYSTYGDTIWKRKIDTHHQMNLSLDKKRILIMSQKNHQTLVWTRKINFAKLPLQGKKYERLFN